jgi:hypothetical protein
MKKDSQVSELKYIKGGIDVPKSKIQKMAGKMRPETNVEAKQICNLLLL